MSDCPQLDPQVISQLAPRLRPPTRPEPNQLDIINPLKQQVARIDFAQRAPIIGGHFKEDALGGRLVIQSLGKIFEIDRQGQVYSECHIIPWVTAPLLAYITAADHQEITGRWINFRELHGSAEWQNLFASRCEYALKRLIDTNPELLHDLAELFTGRTTTAVQADIALILHPLPHFPLLICWQGPEDGLESTLTILLDACCSVNLDARATFSLCVGLVQMFDRITKMHT